MELIPPIITFVFTILITISLSQCYTLNKTNALLSCPDYGGIDNAIIDSMNPENDISYQILHISCDLGYELIGHPKIVCTNGVWEPSERPKCIKRCDRPPFLHNGLLQVDGEKDERGKYNKGAVAIYSCDKDFTLIPPESNYRVCEMGNWTGAIAECIPNTKYGCKRPKGIPNGYFVSEKYNLEILENSYYESGQRLHYECNQGYVLSGVSVQQCLEGGSWSPKIPPVCMKISEEDHRCPARVDEFASAEVIRGAVSTSSGLALLGTELEIRCHRGYFDKWNKCRPALLRCIAPGVWDGTPPLCVPVSSCGPPPVLENGKILNYATNTDTHDTSIILDSVNGGIDNEDNEIDNENMTPRYRFGSQVTYKCSHGYQLHGNFVLKCMSTGCWHPNTLPVCYPDHQFLEDYVSTGGTVLVALTTAAGVMLILLGMCSLVIYRRRKFWFPISDRSTSRSGGSGSTSGSSQGPSRSSIPPPLHINEFLNSPAASALLHDPDRLALIAYADGLQSGLPTYEEAIRERNSSSVVNLLSCRPHRNHWSVLSSSSRRSRGSQISSEMNSRQNTCMRAGNVTVCGTLGGTDPMGSTDTMTPSEVSTNITLDTVSSHTCSSGSQVASCRAICGSLASFDTSSVNNTEGVPLLEESEQEENAATTPAGDNQSSIASAADNILFKLHTSPESA